MYCRSLTNVGHLSLFRVLTPRPQLGEADECSFLQRAEQVTGPACLITGLKGTVSRDFLLLVFFLYQFPPSL
jgi:hypothetical protein